MKERILWIDFLKVVAMFLVIWGHSLMHYGLPDEKHYSLECAGWIYTFHMPLFMILSGFVSSKLLNNQGDIHRKFDQLIVPSFFCYVIYEFVGDTNNLWYLKSLFVCYVLYSWMLRIKGYAKYIVIGLFCLLTFPILTRIPIVSSWKIDWMFPFFGIGLILHENIDVIKKHLTIISIISLLVYIVFLFFYKIDYIYYFSSSRWFDYRAICDSNVHFLHVKSMIPCIYRYVIGTFGSLFLISVSMILEYRCGRIGSAIMKLAPYGKYSLHLFILGNALFILGHHYNFNLPYDNTYLYSFVFCMLVALFQTIFYVFVSKILEKNSYINKYVFGQQ